MTQAANNSQTRLGWPRPSQAVAPAPLAVPSGVNPLAAPVMTDPLATPAVAPGEPLGGAGLLDAFVSSAAGSGSGSLDLHGEGDSWQVSSLAQVLAAFQPAPAAPSAAVTPRFDVPPAALAAAPSGPALLPAPTPQVDVPLPAAQSPAPAPAPATPAAPAVAYRPASTAAAVLPSILNAGTADDAFRAAIEELNKALEERHRSPQNYADSPGDPAVAERLKTLAADELARLGQQDKKAFFEALRPAAQEAERIYGVPAAVTMAQAALETGWGKHIIPGYNIFGIKGKGPAGSVRKGTWEVYGGKTVTITANFAQYHNFHEAVVEHGKLFHNGYYDKAMNQYAKDHDPVAFARNITGVYATDPSYGSKLTSIMRQYGLI